jgi:hypothetical protein
MLNIGYNLCWCSFILMYWIKWHRPTTIYIAPPHTWQDMNNLGIYWCSCHIKFFMSTTTYKVHCIFVTSREKFNCHLIVKAKVGWKKSFCIHVDTYFLKIHISQMKKGLGQLYIYVLANEGIKQCWWFG